MFCFTVSVGCLHNQNKRSTLCKRRALKQSFSLSCAALLFSWSFNHVTAKWAHRLIHSQGGGIASVRTGCKEEEMKHEKNTILTLSAQPFRGTDEALLQNQSGHLTFIWTRTLFTLPCSSCSNGAVWMQFSVPKGGSMLIPACDIKLIFTCSWSSTNPFSNPDFVMALTALAAGCTSSIKNCDTKDTTDEKTTICTKTRRKTTQTAVLKCHLWRFSSMFG